MRSRSLVWTISERQWRRCTVVGSRPTASIKIIFKAKDFERAHLMGITLTKLGPWRCSVARRRGRLAALIPIELEALATTPSVTREALIAIVDVALRAGGIPGVTAVGVDVRLAPVPPTA